MPWVKRADGTWGNAVVDAPVASTPPPTSTSDSEDEGVQAGSIAARAARFQAAQTPVSSIVKQKAPPPPILSAKKPLPSAERAAVAPPPPYAPAFPPRRKTPDEDSVAVTRPEPKPIRPANAALQRRPPPPPTPLADEPDTLRVPSAYLPPPLPSRQPSTSSAPQLLPRQPSPSAPPLPSRPTQSAPTPPLPPRSAPALPARTPSESKEEEEKPASWASTTRNPNLRPPPSRTKTTGIDYAQNGPSWSNDKAGFVKGKTVEMAANRRDCLNPPPACFAREPPPPSGVNDRGIQVTYAPLSATIVLRSANSNDLAKAITTGRAFPNKPPALLTHDVQREDWNKLWDDIDETARIELRASAGVSVATLPLMPIFGAGLVVSTVAERKLRANRVAPTCKLIEAWNVNFFRPRRLDVYLAQDSIRLSGPTPTTNSRRAVDPIFIKWQQAESALDKAALMKEYEKYEGKFRFVVQSWPGDS
ncbi:hypothetical protein MKEN_00859100 [Mycena kentingensis (nom. inval.)]|nr:hypothetical protein MKEN_00859100 [Mycena kentingensis (nom. inval.)]